MADNSLQHKSELSSYVCKLATKEQSETLQEVLSRYDDWSEDYENDELILGYKVHISLVDLLEDVMKIEPGFSKSSKILDVAAGTGLVVKELLKRGFNGQIDAHDGSENMR